MLTEDFDQLVEVILQITLKDDLKAERFDGWPQLVPALVSDP